MIQFLIGPVIGLAKSAIDSIASWGKHRSDMVKAKRELQIAKVKARTNLAERALEIQAGMMDADMAQLVENRSSYIDEMISLTVFSFPIVAYIDPARFAEFTSSLLGMPWEFKAAWLILIITKLAGRGLLSPIGKLYGKKI